MLTAKLGVLSGEGARVASLTLKREGFGVFFGGRAEKGREKENNSFAETSSTVYRSRNCRSAGAFEFHKDDRVC